MLQVAGVAIHEVPRALAEFEAEGDPGAWVNGTGLGRLAASPRRILLCQC
jgi:hypothetical protein